MGENSKDLREVLSKMVHDLRTPLAVVQTTTNMLLNPKYKFSEEEVREQHQRIHRNVGMHQSAGWGAHRARRSPDRRDRPCR